MSSHSQPAPDYHAHIYFGAETRDTAKTLQQTITDVFPDADMGRFHEKDVGPHPRWSYQVAFPLAMYAEIVPWLMMNRDGLTIFLHPESGDVIADHEQNAIWMGEMLPLNMEPLIKFVESENKDKS